MAWTIVEAQEGTKSCVYMVLCAEIGILNKKHRTESSSNYDKKIHKSGLCFVEYAPHTNSVNSVISALERLLGCTF